ncbi:endogenous retrovirus group K member 25 Env polyprotein-like [Lepus europaeus]|uniref:endogenous retrovirus group K member 25 Env polyprotein-like n=1 Tax=Lepus europaeus TaxID=9983 RepID=UPI002B480BE1|nr:endogenous retrovirus group K member 25 Env polyprotein-like [Lepus europaeus]
MVRHLARKAKELLAEQRKPHTTSYLFVAFLSLISTPKTEGTSYWAYVPNPPIVQPVGWLDREPVKVLTNDSLWLGGVQDSDARVSSSSTISFEGRADSLPICLTLQGKAPNGCLTTRYRTFLTDGPDHENPGKRWVWETQIQTLGAPSPKYSDDFTTISEVDLPLTPCVKKYQNTDRTWLSSLTKFPTWLSCGFSTTAWYRPEGGDITIWDYSNSNTGTGKYERYIKNHKQKFHGYTYDGLGEQLRRWFSSGFVKPFWFAVKNNVTRKHTDLFRLVAATNMLLEKQPNHTVSQPIGVKACVAYPSAILLAQTEAVNITKEGRSYKITCAACKMTNCITSAEPKDFTTILLVRRPPFVLLPVELGRDDWYDNSALQVLNLLSGLLHPKRFVAALILGIMALITIITTFPIATTALVQEIQTAHYVNTLNRNITMALITQEAIDQKLEAKINVLEEVVLALGQDIANLQTMFSARCHSNFKSICVTPLPYNSSESWEKVKAHLQGVWHDNDITHDLNALQKEIAVASQSKLQIGDLQDIATSLEAGIKNLNPITWKNYLMYIGIVAFVVLLIILFLPILTKCLLNSLQNVQQEVFELHLKNKKGGTATPTAVIPA